MKAGDLLYRVGGVKLESRGKGAFVKKAIIMPKKVRHTWRGQGSYLGGAG